MDVNQLYEGLAEVFQVDVNELSAGSFEINETNLDSLAVLSIIAIVDEKFGVVLDPNELNRVKSVQDIQALVQKGMQ